MDLDIINNIQEKVKNIESNKQHNNTQSEEVELAKKLNAIEEYAVDRFEGEYVVLEDRNTKQIKHVKKDMLPQNIEEGTILQCINGKYIYNEERTNQEVDRIKSKMDKLWN